MNLLDKKFISTKEASEISGYNADYLSRLCREGKIEGTQIGRTWLVSRDSLATFIESQGEKKRTQAEDLARLREQEYRTANQPVVKLTRIGADAAEDIKRTLTRSRRAVSPFVTNLGHEALAFGVALLVLSGSAYAVKSGAVEMARVSALRAIALTHDVSGAFFEDASDAARARVELARADAATLGIARIAPRDAAASFDAVPRVLASAAGIEGEYAGVRIARVPADDAVREPIALDGFLASVETFARHPDTSIASAAAAGRSAYDGIGTTMVRATETIRAAYLETLYAAGDASLALGKSAHSTSTDGPRGAIDTYARGIAWWTERAPEVPARILSAAYGLGDALGNTTASAVVAVPAVQERASSALAEAGPRIARGAVAHQVALGERLTDAVGNAFDRENAMVLDGVRLARAGATEAPYVALGLSLIPGDIYQGARDGALGLAGGTALALGQMPQTAGEMLATPLASLAPDWAGLPRSVVGFLDGITDGFALAMDAAGNFLASLFPNGGRLVIVPVGPSSIPRPSGSIPETSQALEGNITGGPVTVIRNLYETQNLYGAPVAYVDDSISDLRKSMENLIDAVERGSRNNDLDGIAITDSTFEGSFVTTVSLLVTGNTTFEGTLTTGTTTVKGSLDVTGDTTIGGSLDVASINASGPVVAPYFTATSTDDVSTFPNLVGTNATVTNATTTNLYADAAHFAAGLIDVLTSPLAYITDAIVTNLTADNAVLTNATTTNATTTNQYIGNLIVDSATSTDQHVTNLTADEAVIANATTTNQYVIDAVSDNATSTNLFVTSAHIASALVDVLTSPLAYLTDAVITNLTATDAVLTNATTTNATSTNLYATNSVSDNATSTNLFATSARLTTGLIDILTSPLAYITDAIITNLTADNATLGNATTTNATTTNQYVVNLSADNATTTNQYVEDLATANATSTNQHAANLTADETVLANATSTNFFATTAHLAAGLIDVLTSPLAYITDAIIANLTADNAVLTNATTTNATTTNQYVTDLIAANATTTNLHAGELTADNATTTNLTATNAGLANLTGVNATITNATTTSFYAALATVIDGFFTNLTANLANLTTAVIANLTATDADFTNATTTNATSTNQYVTNLTADNASTTNAFADNLVATNGTSTNFNASNLYLTGFTQGSVPFIGANGKLVQDNLGLFFDDTNDYLGLGTTTPGARFSVAGGGLFDGIVAASTFTATSVVATSTMPLLSANSFALGNDYFTDLTGNALVVTGGTLNVSTTSLASGFFQQGGNSFGATATLGTNDTNDLAFETDGTTKLTILSGGNVGIGNILPNYKLDVSGDINTTGKVRINGTQALYIPGGSFTGTMYVGDGGGSLSYTSGNDGRNNTATGLGALFSNTTGNNNVAYGYNSLRTNTTGIRNSAVGYESLRNNTIGFSNTANGYEALKANVDGNYNTAGGASSLQANTSGSENTAYGTDSMFQNTEGSYNTAIGRYALFSNTTADNNTANGTFASYSNITGTENATFGYSASYAGTTGSYNTVSGASALRFNSTGGSNAIFGYRAGYGANAVTDISGNAIFGYQAGYGLRTGGDNNTLFGYQAGDNITTGARNILIGYDVDAPSAAGSDQLNIGNAVYGDLSTGNVGIGTTSPSWKFSVAGIGSFDDYVRSSYFNATSTAATSTFAGGFSAAGANGLTVLQNGRVGIHTIAPTSWFEVFTSASNPAIISATEEPRMRFVAGGQNVGIINGFINDSFNIWSSGGIPLRLGAAETTAFSILPGGTTEVTTSLIPTANATYDIGSPAFYWDDSFFDSITTNNLSAASTSIAGTNNGSFSINSDNVTADTEDASLIFYRGVVVPNAVINWNSTADRFEFNQNTYISSDTGATAPDTFTIQGVSGQDGFLTKWVNAAGATLAGLTSQGYLGLGIATSTARLSVGSSTPSSIPAGNLYNSAFISGDLEVAGTLYGSIAPAGFTEGSVVFAGPGGILSQDNANFFWDNGSDNLGLGTTSPSQKLSVSGNALISGGVSAASATVTGAVSAGSFAGAAVSSLTANYLPKWNSGTFLNSLVYDSGTQIGIGTNSNLSGALTANGTFGVQAEGDVFRQYDSGDAAWYPLLARYNTGNGTFPASTFLFGNGTNSLVGVEKPGGTNVGTFRVRADASTFAGTGLFSGLLTLSSGFNIGSQTFTSLLGNALTNVGGTLTVSTTSLASGFFQQGGNSFGATAVLGTNDANDLAFETGGSTKMTILANGNVGIGAAVPVNALEVSAAGTGLFQPVAAFYAPNNTTPGNASQLKFGISNTTGNSAEWRYVHQGSNNAANRVELGFNGYTAPALAYTLAGNVGIGTTSPFAHLSVGGDAYIGGNLTATGTVRIANTNALNINTSGALGGGDIDFYTDNSTGSKTLAIFGSNTSTLNLKLADGVLRVEGSGNSYFTSNLGVGTTTPGALFSVAGAGLFTGTATAGNLIDLGLTADTLTYANSAKQLASVTIGNGLTFTGGSLAISTTSLASGFFQQGGNSFGAPAILGTNDTQELRFETDGTTRVTIDANGAVGIGAAVPATNLHIAQASNTSWIGTRFENVGNSTFDYRLYGAGSSAYPGMAVLAAWNSEVGMALLSDEKTNIDDGSSLAGIFIKNGNVGVGTSTPGSTLHVLATSVANKFIDSYAASEGMVVEGAEGRLQFIARNTGTGGAGLLLTNAPSTGNNTNWNINHVGQNIGDGLLFRYSQTTAAGQDSYGAGTGTVDALYLSQTGNVGVGTTSPGQKLTVAGNLQLDSAADSSIFFTESGASRWLQAYSVAGDYLYMRDLQNGRDLLTLYDNGNAVFPATAGNVGIGTTTPGALFSVAGAGLFTGTGTFGNLIDLGLTADTLTYANGSKQLSSVTIGNGLTFSSGTLDIATSSLASGFFLQNGNSFGAPAILGTNDSQNLALETGGTTRLTIDTSGNIGIGTTTPIYALDVKAPSGSAIPLRLTGNPSTAGSENVQMRFAGKSGIERWAIGNAVATNDNSQNFDIYDLVSGANRLRINSSGNVGIGTTSPQGTLTIHTGQATFPNGTFSAPSIAFNDDLNTGIYKAGADQFYFTAGGAAQAGVFTSGFLVPATKGIYLDGGGNTYLSEVAADTMNFVTGGSERLRITSTGNVGIGTTTPAQLLSVGGNVIIGASTAGGTNGTLTYGGVTFANTATGTGSLVGSISPTFTGTVIAAGISASSLTDSGLTSGRVTYAGTAGLLQDSANLTFNGTTLTANALAVTNGTTLSGALTYGGVTLANSVTGTGSMVLSASPTLTGVLTAANIIDTGVTANSLVYANGSQQFAATTIGNGLTFTAGTLDIATSSLASGFFLQNGNSFGAPAILGTNDSQNLALETGGTTRLTINTSGNVGIGTSTPSQMLHLSADSGNAAINLQRSGAATTGNQFGKILFANNANNATGQIASYSASGNTAGSLGFYTAATAGTLIEQMTILSNGNVGVGTTSPAKLLEIAGASAATLRISSTATNLDGNSDISDIEFWNSDASVGGTGVKARIRTLDDNSGVNGRDIAMAFYTADGTNLATERLRISSTGSVGVGTTTPGYKLSIASTGGDQIELFGTAAGKSWRIGSGNNATTNFSILETGVAERFTIAAGGNIGIGTTTPSQKLEVYGNIAVSSGGNIYGDTTNPRISLTNAGGASIGYSASQMLVGNNRFTFTIASTNLGYWDASGFRIGAGTTASNPLSVTGNADITGNLGIGTTTPGVKFDINGGSNGTTALAIRGTTVQATLATDKLTLNSTYGTTDGGGLTAAAGNLTINNSSGSGSLIFTTGSTERGRFVGSTGNFGIGTTTPGALFSVAGAGLFTGTGTFGNLIDLGLTADTLTYTNSVKQLASVTIGNGLTFTGGSLAISTTSLASGFFLQDGNSFGATAVLGTNDSQNLALETGGTTRLTINTSGNVGIGTTTPVGKLDIKADSGQLGINSFRVPDNSGAFTGGTVGTWLGFSRYNDAATFGGAIGVDNSQIFRINGASGSGISISGASGNVGIANTAPLSKLGVTGNASIGATYGAIAAPTSGLIVEGNVGIGTTSPNVKLNIYTGAAGVAANTNADELVIESSTLAGLSLLTSDGGASQIYFGNTSDNIRAAIGWDQNTSLFTLGTNSVGPSAVQITSGNGVNAMRIDSSGNVGIGTTTPAANLHVFSSSAAATVRIDTQSATNPALLTLADVNASSGSANIYYTPSGATNANILTVPNSAGFQVGTGATGGFWFNTRATGAPIVFATGGNAFSNERMRITSTGLVGIGSTTPYAKLSVKGDGTTTGVNFQTTNSSDAPIFTILDSGKVGIATVNPTGLLEVRGTTDQYTFRVSPEGNGQYIRAQAGLSSFAGYNLGFVTLAGTYDSFGSVLSGATIGAVNAAAWTSGSSPAHMVLSTTPSGSTVPAERVRITSDGNVGIGTTTPTSLYGGVFATAGPIFVGGTAATATSTFEGNARVMGNLAVGTGTTWIKDAATSTFSGGLTVAGSVNITGNFMVNGVPFAGGTGLVSGDVDTSAELAAIVGDETGTGALVFGTSPVLTTPNLGTPSALTLTNATGLPVGGITGFGTGVATFLGTPSTANLAAAVTGETGTGALVFATSPTFVTPILGAASATSLTLTTDLAVANGGTGASTLTGILLGNGTSAVTGLTTSAGISGAISDETGSGALVFGTSPVLTTPNLGTPSALTLTNATGLPVAGITGLGTGVATLLATPSTANLAAAITGETGTGAVVFGTSPSLTTPAIAGATLSSTISGGTFSGGTWQGNAISSTYLDTAVILSTEIDTYAELNAIVSDVTLTHNGLIDTSAEIAGIVGDETGSGALVFAGSPTFTGTAAFASLTASTAIDAHSGTNAGEFRVGGTTAIDAASGALLKINTGGFTDVAVVSGNFGIGSTTPYAKLSVKGAGTTTGVNFQTTNSSDAPIFTILDNGKVGIGTATPGYTYLDVGPLLSNTANQAHVAGTIFGSNGNGATLKSTTSLYGIYTSGGTNIYMTGTGVLVQSGGGPSANPASTFVAYGNAAIGSVYGNVAAPTNGLLVAGNVGLGTTTPYARLSVAGGTSGTVIAADALSGFSGYLLELKVASTTVFSVNQAGGLTLASDLAVTEGGTGVSTITGIVKGNGTSAFTAATLGTDYINNNSIDLSSEVAAIVTDETGSGALVFGTSPVLTTPNLGTPSALTLTNATGLPVGGITGFGTGVATFLGTPSTANLAAAVTGETGTGALVFATSPTFVTPILGAASATSLTLTTDLAVANGGTGASTLTGILLGNGTSAVTGLTTSAGISGALSDETGSGALVFGTSPVLTTPNLGTPSALTLTNATGLPVAGITGLGTGVATFLGTPSSANLAAAITNETGSGALVFGTSPALTTPSVSGALDFGASVGDKILLYSNAFGIGIESGTLTNWSSSTHRWRIGGTSVSTGTEYMTLTTTGLSVTGSVTATSLTLTTDLSVANGGTGASTLTGILLGNGTSAVTGLTTSAGISGALSDETGSGALVFGTSPVLTTPNLGTPSALTLTNATGLPISGITGLGTGVGTFLATPSSANLAAAVTDETGSGALVFGTSPTIATPTFSGLVTAAPTGTYGALTLAGSGSGFSGIQFTSVSSGGDTLMMSTTGDIQGVFRQSSAVWSWYFQGGVLTAGTVPVARISGLGSLATLSSVNDSNWSGTDLSVANGGSGVSTLTGILLGNGTSAFTGLTTSAGISGALSDETGSGALVFGTSPVLTTPNLGTPSALTLTNATGLPVGGITGFGTGVATFLATPSSANLATAITNETGSGALVFATSPTFVTPVLGAASATSLTLTTDLSVANGGTGASTLTGILLGNGTSAVTGLTTSAGISGALSDETGSGALVFAASPTLTGTVTAAAATLSSTLTLSGTAANIALGSNYLSGDGADEGVFVDPDGDVGIGTASPGNSRLAVTYSGGDFASVGVLQIDASGSSISGAPGFMVKLPATGNQKGFQIINGSDSTAWASFEFGVGGASKPGLAIGPGGATARDVFLYRDAATTLKTNSSLVVGGGFTAAGLVSCSTVQTNGSGVFSCGSGGGLSSTDIDTSLEIANIVTNETGSGALVFATSPTFVTPILGAASATSLTLTTDLSVANGGTGASTFTSNGLLYGNGTGALQVTALGASGTLLTGTGGAPAFSASPTLTTSLTVPMLIGGTAAGSTLSLKSTSGTGTSDAILFLVGSNGATEAGRFLNNGNFGIGTTTPGARLAVTTTATAQLLLGYDTTRSANLQVDSTGDLLFDTTGQDVRFNDENLWVCAGGSCPAGTPSGNGNLVVESRLGIGTGAPSSALTIAAGGAITVQEKALSTPGSTLTVDWRDGNQQTFAINTTTTISFSNYTAGQRLMLIICASGGSISWGTSIYWSNGVAPGYSVGSCDVWSFIATGAKGGTVVFGAQTPNF